MRKLLMSSKFENAFVAFMLILVVVSMCAFKHHKVRSIIDPKPKNQVVKSVTVHCKDGSQYVDVLDAEADFRCNWKELVFNY